MWRGRVLTAAGPRGRQCRRPAPSAPCSRAQAPRAGGLGAAFRFGWGGEGSRRRQAHEQGPAACGAFGDAALPRWARGAAGVRGRRCLPCGQRRCRVARWIMACRGRERGFRSGLPIREIYQRAGERGNGPHPAGDGDTRHLADRTRPSPGKTFRIILPPQTRRSTRHVSLPAFRGEPPDACLQLSAPVYSQPAPFTTCLRRLRRIPRPLRRIPRPLQRIPRRLRRIPRRLRRIPRSLQRIPRRLRLSHTFCGHSMPVYGLFAPLTAIPCLFTAFPRLLRPPHACL